MGSHITKETLEHLADLARVDLGDDAAANEKLLHDMERILSYFDELKEVPVDDVSPMTGGTERKDVYREDGDEKLFDTRSAVEMFPESEYGFLKIPPVFSDGE